MDGAQSPVKGETLAFGHTIKPGSFIGLSLKNGLLNIITLTLYRFWGKTEVRRRVWSHITLNNEPFEYTGKGRELFLGFLIALLALGVPYLALILAIQFVSPMFTLLMLPLYIAIIVLIGAAIFMTYRYMASRTVWRGVRFQLRGSANKFGWSYLGYTLLVMITLGWYAPAMSMRIAEKLWGGMSYGDQKLRWERSHAEGLYGPFALAWVAGIIGYGVLIAAIVPPMIASMQAGTEPGVARFLLIYGYAFIYALFVMVASAAYHAVLMRTIARSIRLGEARFALNVKAGALIGLTLTNLLLTIFTLGFLTPVVVARTTKFMISRLSSTGEAPLADAMQAERGPKTGEGLADAFDVSPF
ncbi:YjgN family protein [Caulobacter sp. ErkDOM-E]|uniref:YjgN family protein n=1 Tax=Caulobacter sp. ErkDOM-E TaxID=3402778 RepID=UPI003AF875FA